MTQIKCKWELNKLTNLFFNPSLGYYSNSPSLGKGQQQATVSNGKIDLNNNYIPEMTQGSVLDVGLSLTNNWFQKGNHEGEVFMVLNCMSIYRHNN